MDVGSAVQKHGESLLSGSAGILPAEVVEGRKVGGLEVRAPTSFSTRSRVKDFTCYVLALFVSFSFACGGPQKAAVPEPVQAPSRVARVERQPRTVEVSGTVRAADVAALASRSAGFVSRVAAKAGSRARKGELLVLLDDRNLKAQQEKLKAGKQEIEQAVDEAHHQMEAAEAQRQLAANTFERIRSLYEKKAASRQEFEEAESRKKAADASWQAVEQRVAQVEAKSRQVDSDLQDLAASFDYVRILAPFDGVITSVPVDEGTFVNPGQTVVTMENPSAYQVLFSAEEELLGAVSKDQRVSVLIPALSGDSIEATIAEVNAALDESTRTFQVKADLPAHSGLRGGLSATVLVETMAATSLWIPMEFLSLANDIESVTVKQGNDWRKVLVKSGRQQNGKVEILSGLNEGEEIGLF